MRRSALAIALAGLSTSSLASAQAAAPDAPSPRATIAPPSPSAPEAPAVPGLRALPPPVVASAPALPGAGAAYSPPYGYPPPGYDPRYRYPQGYYPYGYYYPYPYRDYGPPPIPKRLRDPRMMAAGIGMFAAGMVAVLVGSVLLSASKDRVDIYCDGGYPCAHMDQADMKTGGISLLIGGAVATAVGIPLWVVGARKVPVEKRKTSVRVTANGVSLDAVF